MLGFSRTFIPSIYLIPLLQTDQPDKPQQRNCSNCTHTAFESRNSNQRKVYLYIYIFDYHGKRLGSNGRHVFAAQVVREYIYIVLLIAFYSIIYTLFLLSFCRLLLVRRAIASSTPRTMRRCSWASPTWIRRPARWPAPRRCTPFAATSGRWASRTTASVGWPSATVCCPSKPHSWETSALYYILYAMCANCVCFSCVSFKGASKYRAAHCRTDRTTKNATHTHVNVNYIYIHIKSSI